MSSQSTILFLELDGALYDQRITDQTAPGAIVSSGAQILAEIAAPYVHQLEIVVTDAAALHSPLQRFREQLPESLAARVIDSVYLEELTNASWSDYHSALASRYACIVLWLRRRRPQHTDGWLALDAGHDLDSWHADELYRLVCGPLLNPSVQRALAETLKAQQRGTSY